MFHQFEKLPIRLSGFVLRMFRNIGVWDWVEEVLITLHKVCWSDVSRSIQVENVYDVLPQLAAVLHIRTEKG